MQLQSSSHITNFMRAQLVNLSFVSKQGLLALGDYMNVQCHACIGGTNVGEDIRKLDYGQHVVAGTPGRVFGKELCKAAALQVQMS